MNAINQLVQTTLEKLTVPLEGETILVAVSGGVDSLVLLHVLAGMREAFGYDLHVATFDHGLRGEAGRADVEFVVQLAHEWDLAVTRGAAEVREISERLSVEAAARQARYTFLVETAAAQDALVIALGHHRDDQVETLLMHLLRGTGLAGLRGMLTEAPLSESHLIPNIPESLLEVVADLTLIRPLLEVSRADILAYATAHQISYREDATNSDTTLLRNRLRHEVVPLLENINPNLKETLGRTATILQGDYELIQGVVENLVARLVEWGETEEGEIAYVDRLAFNKENQGVQRQVMRRLVTDLIGEVDLPYLQVETACEMVRNGRTGQQMMLPLGLKLSIGYDEFTLHYGGEIPFPLHLPKLRPGQVVPLSLEGQGHEINGMRLYCYWVIEGRSKELYREDILEATLVIKPEDELSLRTRRTGDRFVPLGMDGHSQKLADIFTNLKVPQALRDRVPLLTVNDEIAWFIAPTAEGVRGRVSERFAVQPQSESVLRLRWELLPEK